MKNKYLISFFILLSVFSFSYFYTDKTNINKEILSGNSFTNIMPYPDFNTTGIYAGEYYLGYINKPYWVILGKYVTDWSYFERGLYLSDSLPYVEGITMGYDYNSVKIISGIYGFDPVMTEKELEIQSNPAIDQNSDRRFLYGVGFTDKGYAFTSKVFAIHRIEFNFLKKITLSLNEINLIGGKLPDIVDINPLGILHNTFGEGYSNTILGLDLNIVPFRGFSVYGQFAMDDYVVPATEAGAINYKPTSFAYAGGIKNVYRINEFIISPKFEYYKIYTWMYNRWQKLLKFTGIYNGIEYPMGFDYGNDMEGYLIGIDINHKKFNYKFIFESYLKGEIDLSTPYDDPRKPDYEQWPGPYGNTRKFIKLSFLFGNN